jgi:integrase
MTIPLSRQALALVSVEGTDTLLGASEWSLRKPLIQIFGEREMPRGKEARVRPHDLRRLFETTGIELGISDTVIDKLMGHAIKGVRRHYANRFRIDVLREATQRIGDAIDNPKPAGSARIDLPNRTAGSNASDSLVAK